MIDYEGDKTRILSTAGRGETFAEVLARRLSRRGVVKGGVAAGALAVTGPQLRFASAQDGTPVTEPAAAGTLAFEAIALDEGDAMVVPDGYIAEPFLRWGDPLFADSPEFDPANQTAAAQAQAVRLQLRLDRLPAAAARLGLPPTTVCWSSTTSTPTPS